jgi:wyosine [tRNA(Phe)-imidazoG37] synthetase (radical SAM superfamily)
MQCSPKFGKILPIDYSCEKKQIDFYPTDEIFSEIKDFFTKKESPDYIWLKGINEISLFLGFQRLINLIKETFPNQKIGVYINASLLTEDNIRKTLLNCDLVVINLNSVIPSHFYQSCICTKNSDIEEILNGIQTFKNDFKGYFSIYTMFLKGINDNVEDIVRLKNYLIKVNPNHLSVNIFTGNGFEPISDEIKVQIKEKLQNMPLNVSFTF